MPTAADVPTAATAKFVLRHLPPAPARVLEVGCGDGAVAAQLRQKGHEVVAIDADPAMVAAARVRGVDARCVRWPDFIGDGFDAIAFTRSLHHMEALQASVDRATAVLRPHGLVLVEDFAFDEVDAAALRWFAKGLQRLDRDGMLRSDPGELACKMLTTDDPKKVWAEEHDHDLHPFAAIEQALTATFRPTFRDEVAYFYRYLVPVIAAGPKPVHALVAFARNEQERVRGGKLKGLGRRLVARAPLRSE